MCKRYAFLAMMAWSLVLATISLPAIADIKIVPYASGLSSPVDIASANDNTPRMFIVEQPGRIRIVRNGILLATPFLDLTGTNSIVSSGGERGLLGLAFHPNYATNGFFFVYFTSNANGGSGLSTGDIVIARFQRSVSNPNLADASSRFNILTISHSAETNHNGGSLRFGLDGYLYAGVGDGGGGGDPFASGQNRNTLLGKILRLDINAAAPYIPATNPYATNGLGLPQIWAYGLRNPWRISFDRANGDFYIGDVGQNEWEEVNRQLADFTGGANYGWKILEGMHCYSPSTGCTNPPNYVAPILEYSHTDGFSITGGYVYRGQGAPDLVGRYVFGDYSRKLWHTAIAPTAKIQIPSTIQVSTFGESQAGELFVADIGGGSIFEFSSTGDITPDPVAFAPATSVPLNTTVVSELVRITGLGSPAPVAISGGEYTPATAAGCGNSYTTSSSPIATDTYICLRHTSANTGNAQRTTMMTIGTSSFSFTSTTIPPPATFTVTSSMSGNGFVSPLGTQIVTSGAIVPFGITPASGNTVSVGGTCGGTLNGTNYNTSPVTANCTVIATFSAAPPSAPGAPVIGTATAGDTTATIAFAPPASNGGSAVTSYTATCGGVPRTAAQSPIIVTGLVNGTPYTCSVTATNAAGTGPASATVSVTPDAATQLGLSAVKSRKIHGASEFDLDIDLVPDVNGPLSVEPRNAGNAHRIVFQFNVPISTTAQAVVTNSVGATIPGGMTTIAGSEVTVTLPALPDMQRINIALPSVQANNGSSLANVSAPVAFILGDVTRSRAVNASDLSAIKARYTSTLTQGNFRFDVNLSGNVDAADLLTAKARSGNPAP